MGRQCCPFTAALKKKIFSLQNQNHHACKITYILSLVSDVSSSDLTSATLLQNFLIRSSLFSVTISIRERRLFMTPSSSKGKDNKNRTKWNCYPLHCTLFYRPWAQILYRPEFSLRPYFHYCLLKSVHYCEDHFHNYFFQIPYLSPFQAHTCFWLEINVTCHQQLLQILM